MGLAVYAKLDYDDAKSKHDIARANRDVRTADFCTALAIASVATLGTAAYFYWFAPDGAVIAPGVTAGSVGVTVLGRF